MSENENLEGMENMEEFEPEQAEAAVSQPPAKASKDKAMKKTAEKKAKPGVFARVSRWAREMRSELKKVQWPSRTQTLNNTWVVIICVILIGACIWVFDAIAGGVIQALIALAKG